MKSLINLSIACLPALFSGNAFSQGLDLFPGEMVVDVIEAEGEGNFFPEMTEFKGNTSDVTTNPDNYCFDATPATTFKWGKKVSFNTFWTDQAQSDGVNTYLIKVAVQPPPPAKLMMLCDYTWKATVTPGKTYNFCFGCFVQSPSGPRVKVTLPWGSLVQEDNGDKSQGKLGSITLQP